MARLAPILRPHALRLAALRRAAMATAALALTACGGDARRPLDGRPIAEVPHDGYRRDIPADRRGNATFERAVITRDGRFLVTLGPGVRVWDARTGALLRVMPATLDANDPLIADGSPPIMVARRGDVAPNRPEAADLQVWDLRDGTIVGTIPNSGPGDAVPVGITPTGQVVVLRRRAIERWARDGRRTSTITPPQGMSICTRGVVTPATYTDRACFELSRSGRWLAVSLLEDSAGALATPVPHLADLDVGRLVPVPRPDDQVHRGTPAFVFSSDERRIVVAMWDGLWIWHRDSVEESSGDRTVGRFIAGDQARSNALVPMAFTADDRRLVALGDQTQVNTFDVATGQRIGRTDPPFGATEGSLRVSADGSRAVAYRFLPDILVVIDGSTGEARGYVCPFFCNRRHQPVEVPFAVSPDGRRIATGGRLGAGLWDADADTLIAPLMDPSLPALVPR